MDRTGFAEPEGAAGPALDDLALAELGALGLGEVGAVREFAAGANNEILLVELGGIERVLKRTRPGGVLRLSNERSVLRILGGRGAPKLLWSRDDPGARCELLLMERAPGESLFEADHRAARHLGEALRQVHSVAVDGLRELDRPTWRETLDRRLRAQLDLVRGAAPKEQVRAMEEHLGRIGRLGEAMGPGDDRRRALVHTDLTPLNILHDGKGCRIVDWELGRIDHPEWDLASVRKAVRFSDGAWEEFLRAWGFPVDASRLRLCALLHWSNVALWRMYSFHVRGENRGVAVRFLGELRDEIDWIGRNLT